MSFFCVFFLLWWWVVETCQRRTKQRQQRGPNRCNPFTTSIVSSGGEQTRWSFFFFFYFQLVDVTRRWIRAHVLCFCMRMSAGQTCYYSVCFSQHDRLAAWHLHTPTLLNAHTHSGTRTEQTCPLRSFYPSAVWSIDEFRHSRRGHVPLSCYCGD